MSFQVGDVLTINAIALASGVLADPTTATFTLTDPASVVTPYTWPTPDTTPIIRDAMGQFHIDVTALLPGTYTYVWSSTGAAFTVTTGLFVVDPVGETVTIHVQNQTPVSMIGAAIKVFSTPETIVVGGFTDGSGNFQRKIKPGTYKVEINQAKATFANPYNLVVANTGGLTPQSFTMVGTSHTIADAGDVRTVKVFGYYFSGDGSPVTGRVVVETVGYGAYRPFVASSPDGTGLDARNVGIAAERREVRVDSVTGYWEVTLVADSIVRIVLPDIRLTKTFRVPNDPAITILNIRDARLDPGSGAEVGISADIPTREGLKGVS